MIHLLTNLVGVVAAIVLMLAALVYIVSPKRGGDMLRRLPIFLAGALMGLCLLRQFTACIGLLSLRLLGIAITITAYLVFEARRSRPQHLGSRRGAERTPLLPPNEENQ